MRRALLVVLAGCTLQHANIATTTAAAALITCDYGQTMWHATRGWSPNQEDNPVLGKTPGASDVTTYFGVIAIAYAALIRLVPREQIIAANIPVLILESAALAAHKDLGGPLCGL